MTTMRLGRAARWLLLLGAGACLPSCGSFGTSALVGGTGTVTVRAVWPVVTQKSRLIPAASNSIKVLFQDGATIVGSAVIAKPAAGGAATAKVNNLPAKPLSELARAYPSADGTGVAQASGSTGVTVLKDKDTAVTITLDSTIISVGITKGGAVTGSLTLAVGDSAQLAASPQDVQNQLVLIVPNTIQWTSSAPTVATVGATTGLVTAVSPGSSTITGLEPESRVSGTVAVQVQAPCAGSPQNVSSGCGTISGVPSVVHPGDTITFTTHTNGGDLCGNSASVVATIAGYIYPLGSVSPGDNTLTVKVPPKTNSVCPGPYNNIQMGTGRWVSISYFETRAGQ